jgi:ABC-type transport system involved in Fe-S cluster assembly fused permease/ATPase subunit
MPGCRQVLAIAHRLATVIDYDQIIMLDRGSVAEAGTRVASSRGQGGPPGPLGLAIA